MHCSKSLNNSSSRVAVILKELFFLPFSMSVNSNVNCPRSCALYALILLNIFISKELKHTLQKIEDTIEEIYQDKINKIIQIEDFKAIYEKKLKERNKILKEIKEIEKELEETNQKSPKINFKEIKQIANKFLKMEKPNKMILEKLIEKIEFDKEKDVKISFVFEKIVETK